MRLNSTGLLGLTLASLLSACGGGGGGGSDVPSTPAPPMLPTEPTPPPEPTPETFSLSGTITASTSQAVDSDTNDPTRLAIPNNDEDTAQLIPNPITLGGYVNRPGSGAAGRSQTDGDINDYFRVDLLEGQAVTMLVADFEGADADLYLHDENGEIVALSIDTGEQESLVAPATGTYFINVLAFRGATNYILAVGALPVNSPTASHVILPYQAIVKYNTSVSAEEEGETDAALDNSMAVVKRAGGRGRSRLMAMRPDITDARQAARRLGAARSKSTAFKNPSLKARWETLLTIKSLRQDPRVEYAEPNYEVKALAEPNDQGYSAQWHYPLIGLPDAWEITTGSANVIVAVVDTGILSNHPDMAGQLTPGYDFVADIENAGDGNGIDPNPEDVGGGVGGVSGSFHGTHVAGTVAARGDNLIGVAGSAYTTRVMPMRALGSDGSGSTYDVNQAVAYAAGLPNDSGTVPAQAADIINLSLAGGGFSQASQDLYNAARAAGVTVVAAAGNEASRELSYPASYSGVISVSAVDQQRRLAPYSNFGNLIDVAAPGGDNSVDLNGDGYPDGVLSTSGSVSEDRLNFVYTFLNGTSMASPHVAGVIALMKSVNPALTPDDIDALLEMGMLTEDIGSPGRDNQYGYGLINAQRAVVAALEAAGSSPVDNPRLVSSTNSLNFGPTLTELEIVLRNGGKGALQLSNVTASEPWLSLTPLDVDESELGTYRVTVDRQALPAGVSSAEITAQSTVNNLVVRILVSSGTASANTDVGVIYILLYDSVANEPVQQFSSSGDGAQYTFNFEGVEAGEYEIIAGSDADNDLLICDAGEACGAWLTTDQPISIDVAADVADLNFPVEFLVALPNLAQTNEGGTASNEGTGNTSRARARLQ
ncbi:MAG: S8 family serine peptidase [Halioglobus sp.]